MEKLPCVYLLAADSHSTFYMGVTSDLMGRIWQHRTGAIKGFTARYGIKRLVWFEMHETMHAAITREKQIKRWARAWKYDLVNSVNPTWRDLAEDLGFESLLAGRQADPGSTRERTNVCLRTVADMSSACDAISMTPSRIGALDIAEAIHESIGSYVDMNFMQFLGVEGDRIHCWYMNSGGKGPTFHIELVRSSSGGWTMELTEHPPGTEQVIEVP